MLNRVTMPKLLDLGVGKRASAYVVEAAAMVYGEKGYKFYYADEREEDGTVSCCFANSQKSEMCRGILSLPNTIRPQADVEVFCSSQYGMESQDQEERSIISSWQKARLKDLGCRHLCEE